MLTTPPTFLLALAASLRNRPGLSGVDVSLVPTGDTSTIEAIILVTGKINGTREHFSMSVQRERITIPGMIEAFAADADTDVAFQTAFSRAGALANELAQEVEKNRPPVGISTIDAIVSTLGYTPLVRESGGWVVRSEFVIEYQATVT